MVTSRATRAREISREKSLLLHSDDFWRRSTARAVRMRLGAEGQQLPSDYIVLPTAIVRALCLRDRCRWRVRGVR